MFNHELVQEQEIKNYIFSPVSYSYLLNNWCVVYPHYGHHFIFVLKANMAVKSHMKTGEHLTLKNIA